jgi:hypothetical protein
MYTKFPAYALAGGLARLCTKIPLGDPNKCAGLRINVQLAGQALAGGLAPSSTPSLRQTSISVRMLG